MHIALRSAWWTGDEGCGEVEMVGVEQWLLQVSGRFDSREPSLFLKLDLPTAFFANRDAIALVRSLKESSWVTVSVEVKRPFPKRTSGLGTWIPRLISLINLGIDRTSPAHNGHKYGKQPRT